MPLRIVWKAEEISAAIAPALDENGTGEARVLFNNIDEAEKFRYACYDLRRRKGIGTGLSFVLSFNEDEQKHQVLITKTPTFQLTRVSS